AISASLHLTDDVSGVAPASVAITLDGNSVTSSFTSISAPTLDATLTGSFTVTHGTHTFVANASDVAGNAAAAASAVFVYDRAPTAAAGANQSTWLGNSVSFDGSGSSDPDSDPLTYAWSIAQRPSGSTAQLTNANTAHPSFTADAAGSYTISLVVNDGWLSSAASTLTLTITADNTPPDLSWVSPTPNQIFQTSNFTPQLHLTDDLSGIDPASVQILLDA